MRDPRKPVTPIAVEHDEGHVEIMGDGRVRRAARVILEPDDVGRMRAGYVCARCWEPHEEAYPEHCRICKFPMKERQNEFLGRAYQGDVRVGPSTSLEDELALLDEIEEIQRRESEASVSRIVVPRVI